MLSSFIQDPFKDQSIIGNRGVKEEPVSKLYSHSGLKKHISLYNAYKINSICSHSSTPNTSPKKHRQTHPLPKKQRPPRPSQPPSFKGSSYKSRNITGGVCHSAVRVSLSIPSNFSNRIYATHLTLFSLSFYLLHIEMLFYKYQKQFRTTLLPVYIVFFSVH